MRCSSEVAHSPTSPSLVNDPSALEKLTNAYTAGQRPPTLFEPGSRTDASAIISVCACYDRSSRHTLDQAPGEAKLVPRRDLSR